LKKIGDQQKRLSSKETRTALEEINSKTQRGIKLKELLEDVESSVAQLNRLEVNVILSSLNKKVVQLFPDTKPIPVVDTTKQIDQLKSIQSQIKLEMDSLRKEILAKKGDLTKLGIKEDVNTLVQSSQALQQQIGNANKDLDRYKTGVEKLTELINARDHLLNEVGSSLDYLKKQIDAKFDEFRKSRDESDSAEKELFQGIIQGLEIEGSVTFDESRFCSDILERFVDNRKIKNENDLREEIAGTSPDGSAKRITFAGIQNWSKQALAKKTYFNRAGADGVIEYIFTEWPAFMHVRAIVRLNGKATEVLSIGQRGTLLLKVFLATATAKQVFIIDQPEDNLDNNFIMHELVPLIRKAKKSRQIIMSTHNANLVVNADAEQVIVARLDVEQSRDYKCGSIENPEINHAIRDILEGGEGAFRQRERKYQTEAAITGAATTNP
ncbi:MAG: AAA family ATPase, partial [Anaerolineales bacterium]